MLASAAGTAPAPSAPAAAAKAGGGTGLGKEWRPPWIISEAQPLHLVVQRLDDNLATALRLQPGVLDAHTKECDVYNGEVALVLQTAERPGSQRRFTRARTMWCDGGWIDSRYLLTREEYELQRRR
eukprot:COSAG04_NODE_1878_length_5323_cov_2.633997_4_plen_126_part_00